MSTAVHLHNVTKRFIKPGLLSQRRNLRFAGRPNGSYDLRRGLEEVAALEKVSFQVEEAEIFGVLGATGSGKSTLIRLLATLLQPDEGEVHVFGFDAVRQPAQVQRWINRVSVEASFFKQLSAVDNLVQGARLFGMNGPDLRQQAEDILGSLGMSRTSIHLPMEEMTRPMLQEVALARALLARPRLLLLDEPTRGLDPESQQAAHRLILDLRARLGITVLLATREAREASQLCDRIATLERGQILAVDEPERLDLSLACNLNASSTWSA
jgi:ABC-2 type transport system ATP-binding protein